MKLEIKVDDKYLNIYRLIIITLAVSMYLYMLRINYFVPYWNDEFAYSFIMGTNQKIESLTDIFQSQNYLYHNWTGRVIVHFFVQLFLWLGKDVFNIVNAFFYVLLLFLICSFSKIRKFNTREDLGIFLLVSLMCWFMLPVLGQTAFWLAGSVNYLWATVFILIFLFPYRFLIDNKYVLKNNLITILTMFFLGILAGWSQENTAVIAVAFVGISFFIALKKKIELPLWFFSGIIGCLIGFVYLVLAPGNKVRKETMYFNVGFKDQIINFLQTMKGILLQDQRYLFLILFVAILFYVYKNYKSSKRVLWIALLTMFTGFLSYVAMVASPEFPLRAAFGGAVMIIISITMIVKPNKKLLVVVLVASIIPLYITMHNVYTQYKLIAEESAQRLQIVNKNLEQGERVVKLPKLTAKENSYVFIYDISLNPSYTSNDHFAKYYNLASVSIDKPTMIVELEKAKVNMYQLYYDIGDGINEKDSSKAYIYNQADGNRLFFELPNKPIYSFRLDPGILTNQNVQIKSIEFDNNNVHLKYDAKKLESLFYPLHDISKIKAESGILNIYTNGYDPQLKFINDYTEDVDIQVEFKYPQTDIFQLFYDRGNGFNEKDSISQQLDHNKVFKTSIPLNHIQKFRFDIGTTPHKLVPIKSIIITEKNKKALVLKGSALRNKIKETAQVELKGFDGDSTNLYTEGDDPYIQVGDLDH
ncbi:DUF6056 family protein [Paenibacillus polymyxa]|uniref:DUF3329 domain-containing protein n=1 Tax=Paenibacillus polymyxa TaxID=1406 RepID=UPI00298CD211|nr:DUF6056 family protein [Paenibacillus polymyxa]